MRKNTRPTIEDSDRTEEPRILRRRPVVTQDQDVAGGDRGGRDVAAARRRRVRCARPHALFEVRLLEWPAVDVDPAATRGERLTRQGDDTLDEILDLSVGVLRLRRCFEDDDVAPVHVVQPIAHLVDEHAIADIEGRLHRLGRDVERLKEERLDEDRDDQGAPDQARPLDDRSPRLAALVRPLRAGRFERA
jgi:hypothetical protein